MKLQCLGYTGYTSVKYVVREFLFPEETSSKRAESSCNSLKKKRLDLVYRKSGPKNLTAAWFIRRKTGKKNLGMTAQTTMSILQNTQRQPTKDGARHVSSLPSLSQ